MSSIKLCSNWPIDILCSFFKTKWSEWWIETKDIFIVKQCKFLLKNRRHKDKVNININEVFAPLFSSLPNSLALYLSFSSFSLIDWSYKYYAKRKSSPYQANQQFQLSYYLLTSSPSSNTTIFLSIELRGTTLSSILPSEFYLFIFESSYKSKFFKIFTTRTICKRFVIFMACTFF